MNTIFFIHKNTLNRKPFFLKKKFRKDIWENQMGKHISNSQFTHKKYSYINYLKICHILVCLSWYFSLKQTKCKLSYGLNY